MTKIKPSTQSADKRQEILDTTIAILALDGYPKFTLRNVASKVGVRLAAVQHYFPNKSDLLRAATREAAGRYDTKMEKIAMRPNMTHESRLKAVTKVHLSSCLDPLISGFFFALWALATHDKDAQELHNETYRNACTRFAGLASKLNPALNEEEAMTRGIMITALLEGTAVLASHGKEYEEKQAVLEKNIVNNVLRFVLTK